MRKWTTQNHNVKHGISKYRRRRAKLNNIIIGTYELNPILLDAASTQPAISETRLSLYEQFVD